MAVQIISDLHLESPKSYDIFEIVPKAPYLALLGDIGNIVPHRDDYIDFLVQQLRQFRVVFLVPGNHESYHSSWPEALDIFRDFERKVAEDPSAAASFHISPLERQGQVSVSLNDFYQTRDWDVKTHNEAHQRDLAWLNKEVAELEQSNFDIMIFTHWSPSLDPRAIDPRHTGSSITSAFSTDISQERCFKSPSVKIWAFGHTHFNCDFVIERIDGAKPLRLLANQRGYYFAQAEGFDEEKTIEVK